MEKEILSILEKLGYKDVDVESIHELFGGSVHHVYKFKDRTAGDLIVKCRFQKTKEPLDFEVESKEIVWEADGLKFFSNKEIVIPTFKAVDISSGVLAMT